MALSFCRRPRGAARPARSEPGAPRSHGVRTRARSGVHFLLLAAALAALPATGCDRPSRAPSAGALAVTDDAGRAVVLERPARRVIALIPAQTEIVGLLAGTEVLVARTQWDTDPAIAHLPSVGNALTPSVEWLAAQRPDLVIAWPDAQSRDVVQRLSDVGIPVYASRVESIEEIRSMIQRLGVLLGADDRADSLVQSIDAELLAVRAAVADRPRQTVLYLIGVDPPTVAGPGTFVDELIQVAGGTNVFADLRQLWPQVSLEEVVRRQPDVIIRASERAAHEALAGMAGRPGWREVDAVRHGRVRAVDADLYNRAGASVGRVARDLATRIHPDAFAADTLQP